MNSPDPLADLLTATARGDRRAFARLYDLTAGQLLAVSLGILRKNDRAEEALQEAFTRVWKSAHRFDAAKESAMSWMVTIVRRCALAILVRQPVIASASEMPDYEYRPNPDPDPTPQALQSSEARTLLACLQQLDERQRQSILLAYHEGLSHADLARRFDAPIDMVKGWVRGGLIKLRKCLDYEAS